MSFGWWERERCICLATKYCQDKHYTILQYSGKDIISNILEYLVWVVCWLNLKEINKHFQTKPS